MRLIRYIQPTRQATFARSPWAGLETEIDQLFETALGSWNPPGAGRRFAVDLYEDKDNAYVRAELPGVSRADVNVELADGTLTITASRKTAGANGAGESDSFSRSLTVPENVVADKVAASLENGVLTVTLPKREETKPRKVSVSVN